MRTRAKTPRHWRRKRSVPRPRPVCSNPSDLIALGKELGRGQAPGYEPRPFQRARARPQARRNGDRRPLAALQYPSRFSSASRPLRPDIANRRSASMPNGLPYVNETSHSSFFSRPHSMRAICT